jgi:asparagine synthase (glutamine-hydrolysing)
MLAVISHFGLDLALQKFNGMFAFALWDRQRKVLELARDRFGEKPLYYGWFGHHFLFASELKALKVHPSFQNRINRAALGCYLRYGYIPAPYSIYDGVRKLRPAHRLTVAVPDTDAEEIPYWSAQSVAEAGLQAPFEAGEHQATIELDSLLREAVRSRMEADVPLGAFLSGGIDSSLIVALMQAQSTRPISTFTIGFRELGYDEAGHAKAVAQHLHTDHTELYVTPRELMDVIPRIPCIYDEPFSDSSQLPTLVLSSLVRRSVTVCLSGDGGDELLGGYSRYLRARQMWAATSSLPKSFRCVASRALNAIRTSSAIPSLLPEKTAIVTKRRLNRLEQCLTSAQPDLMYRGLLSCWDDPSGVALECLEPPTILDASNGSLKLTNVLDRLMYFDTVMYLPEDILVKVDRASMSVSLESRMPYLDHELLQFCWRLPRSMKVKGGAGKYLLRRVLDRYVPNHLMERPKKGFSVPLATWLRGPLKGWADDLLTEDSLKHFGILDATAVRKKWSEHLQGAANWQAQIWNILILQSWLGA